MVTMSSYQRALEATEERILHTLSSVQGNILESEEAILILQQTKVRGKRRKGNRRVVEVKRGKKLVKMVSGEESW